MKYAVIRARTDWKHDFAYFKKGFYLNLKSIRELENMMYISSCEMKTLYDLRNVNHTCDLQRRGVD